MVNTSRAKRQVAEVFSSDSESDEIQDYPQQGTIGFSNNTDYGFLSNLESHTQRWREREETI